MAKNIIGIRLEDDLIKMIKMQALKEDRNVNEITEELYLEYLRETEMQSN